MRKLGPSFGWENSYHRLTISSTNPRKLSVKFKCYADFRTHPYIDQRRASNFQKWEHESIQPKALGLPSVTIIITKNSCIFLYPHRYTVRKVLSSSPFPVDEITEEQRLSNLLTWHHTVRAGIWNPEAICSTGPCCFSRLSHVTPFYSKLSDLILVHFPPPLPLSGTKILHMNERKRNA